MKKILSFRVFIYCISFVAVCLISCKKDDDNNSNPIAPTGSTLKITVTGRTTDTDGNVLTGVTVKLGPITTVSDSRGHFLFVNTNVPKDRFVLIASKSGFFNCVRGKKTQSGDANYINLVMQALPAAVNIPGAAGGVVNIPGGATITFQSNSFVDQNGAAYNGQVKVFARHISPGDIDFEAIVPGGDLLGLNTLGEEQSLYSLGMLEAKLYDNTGVNEVKLAPGKTAALKFPIHASQNAVALSTIPMWHLDEETGIWQEEGQGTKTGNYYIAIVSHFSTWNCDYSGPRCDIEGTVVDCNNNIVPNAVVTINGFLNVITNNLGKFSTWVPEGYLLECQVMQINNPFLNTDSPIQSLIASSGQINIIPTLIVPCASRLIGAIKSCNGTNIASGFVTVSWNNHSQLLFSISGNYEVLVPENSTVTLVAFQSGFSDSTSILSGPAGINTTVADLHLCFSTPFTLNKFNLIENGISTTYTINNIFNQSAYFYEYNQDSIFDEIIIEVEGTAIPGNIPCELIVDLFPFQQNMTHLFISEGTIAIILGGNFYSYNIDTTISTSNSLQFMDLGTPGNYCSGIFEFDCYNTQITGGEFYVPRIQ